MPVIEQVDLTVEDAEANAGLQLVTVSFDVTVLDIEPSRFRGRVEIRGGTGDRERLLLLHSWAPPDFEPRSALDALLYSTFWIDKSRAEPDERGRYSFHFDLPGYVATRMLDEDPTVEWRWSDRAPPGVVPGERIPHPDNPVSPPLGLPALPVREEAIDVILARVIITTVEPPGGEVFADSEEIRQTF